MSVINFENKPVLINHNCPNFYCKGDNNNEKTSNMFCSYCPLDIELSRGVITFEGMLLIAGAANVLTTLRKNSEPKFAVIAYRGHPDFRCTLEFLVEDNILSSRRWVNWTDVNVDLLPYYKDYWQKIPQLRQLKVSERYASTLRNKVSLSVIKMVRPGMVVYVDLRSWGPLWYNSLSLPHKHTKTYVTKCIYGSFKGPVHNRKSKILSNYPDMRSEVFTVNNWFVTTYGHTTELLDMHVLVTSSMVEKYNLCL